MNTMILAAFVEKLGDVNDWDATGDTIAHPKTNPGHCVCGHAIHIGYTLRHTQSGRLAEVGSECINHFKEYSPDTYSRLCAAKTKHDDATKDAKRMAKFDVLLPLYNDYLRIFEQGCAVITQHEAVSYYLPKPVWILRRNLMPCYAPQEYATPARAKKAYEATISVWETYAQTLTQG